MAVGIRTYNDFQGLAQLRADAAQRSPDATREAARQFEALFVQMMLKSMRDANAAFGDGSDKTYQEMFDQQIAVEITRGKGLGLGDVIARQLGGTDGAAVSPQSSAVLAMLNRAPAALAPVPEPGLLPEPTLQELELIAPLPPLIPDTVPDTDPAVSAAAAAIPRSSRDDWRPQSREDFVRDLWPHAVRAGTALGVDPKVIVAQAALETGWGQRLIRDPAGVSGNNLFGIKADSRWSGERVTVTTLEYEGGVPRPQRANFRAYPDLATGVGDYVAFLKTNPRYRDALQSGANPAIYAERLQDAGYATDPRYAEKIRSILSSPLLRTATDTAGVDLKTTAAVPTLL